MTHFSKSSQLSPYSSFMQEFCLSKMVATLVKEGLPSQQSFDLQESSKLEHIGFPTIYPKLFLNLTSSKYVVEVGSHPSNSHCQVMSRKGEGEWAGKLMDPSIFSISSSGFPKLNCTNESHLFPLSSRLHNLSGRCSISRHLVLAEGGLENVERLSRRYSTWRHRTHCDSDFSRRIHGWYWWWGIPTYQGQPTWELRSRCKLCARSRATLSDCPLVGV